MSDAAPEARWGAFTHDEREVNHFAVTQAAKRILDDAMADEIPHEMLDSAAGTFLHLSNLARQLDLVAGRPAPNADGAMIVAAMIASGESPEAAKYTAETEDEPETATRVTQEAERFYVDGEPCTADEAAHMMLGTTPEGAEGK